MAHKDEPEIPGDIDAVVSRLDQLEVVLGTAVRPVLAAVRAGLIAALAARARGDIAAAVTQIGQAMDRLSTLADQLDPAEATLMRALTQTFRAALLRGDEATARRSTATMFEKSGAVERKKK